MPTSISVARDVVTPSLEPHCPFLSRFSPGKIAATETHPKAFGTSSNLLTGTPSSVPYPRSDAYRVKGVRSMAAVQPPSNQGGAYAPV
jgi:hypothetical protein